jgi:GNAT superfamily N-acetyltransferase
MMAEDTTLPDYIMAFTPEFYGGFVYGMEPIMPRKDEFTDIWSQHWGETETLYLDGEVKPDYSLMHDYQVMGKLALFTVRHEETGELAGNLAYYLGPSTHVAGKKQAMEDFFFVSKPYRKGRIALKLLKYAEDCLKQLGVDYIGMTDKSPVGGKSLEKLMTRQGYRQIAVYYMKTLEKDNVLQQPTPTT